MADEQITSSTANIPYINFINVGSDQAAPAAGRAILYIKSGVAYVRLDTGDPLAIGGAVALAEGQLAIGNGSGVLSALALGTEGQVVKADASGHATWGTDETGGGGGDTLIAETTVGVGGIASWDQQNIPQTYRALRLEWTVPKTAAASYADAVKVVLNNDTGNKYTFQPGGTGTFAGPAPAQNAAYMIVGPLEGSSNAASGWSLGYHTWPRYRQGSSHRLGYGLTGAFGLTDASTQAAQVWTSLFADSSAISRVTVSASSGSNIPEGAHLALYGVG